MDSYAFRLTLDGANPSLSDEIRRRAAVTVARYAKGTEDLRFLLQSLGYETRAAPRPATCGCGRDKRPYWRRDGQVKMRCMPCENDARNLRNRLRRSSK